MSCRGGVCHVGVGWSVSCRGGVGHAGGGVGHVGVGWGGSCRDGVGQTWLRYLTAPPPQLAATKETLIPKCTFIMTIKNSSHCNHKTRGQIHVLPMTWEVEALGAPFR